MFQSVALVLLYKIIFGLLHELQLQENYAASQGAIQGWRLRREKCKNDKVRNGQMGTGGGIHAQNPLSPTLSPSVVVENVRIWTCVGIVELIKQ